MPNYNYWEDDKGKVVPLETGEDEYEPEDDDIPLECREKKEEEKVEFDGKSGVASSLKVPKILNIPVVNEAGNPLAGQLYRIYLPNGKILFGETDDQGLLKEKIYEPGDLIIEMEDASTITVELE